MNQDQLKAVFDQQAPSYEQQQRKLAPVHAGLHFQLEWIFADLPENARILCVGLGTGAELSYLAARFPHWQFSAVEPSGAMLDVCRERAEKESFASRCTFHEGYLESLPQLPPHDAATCFLVSQFILDADERAGFFRAIAARLKPGGILASADLSSAVGSAEYHELLTAWVSMLHAGKPPADAIAKTHAAWARDVAILPPQEVEAIISRAGFSAPVQFYQAGLLRAWMARCL